MTDRNLVRNSGREGALRAPQGNAERPRQNGRTPIDLGALNDHLGYYIRRAQVWIFQDFIRTLSRLDIRPAQYSVLVVIGANQGLSQADLSAALNIERARLVRLLDRLEKRGLTERRRARTDRRSHALHLTREGQRLLKRAKNLAAKHETRLIMELGPDHHRFMLSILREFGR